MNNIHAVRKKAHKKNLHEISLNDSEKITMTTKLQILYKKEIQTYRQNIIVNIDRKYVNNSLKLRFPYIYT